MNHLFALVAIEAFDGTFHREPANEIMRPNDIPDTNVLDGLHIACRVAAFRGIAGKLSANSTRGPSADGR
jgi:hypothetical protein